MSAGRLRTAEQQKVEILRALSRKAELIVMDEPTAALSGHETRQLHEIVRSLAAAGTSILLISHFLREVLELADTVTVLRDGHLVRTAAASDETESSLIEAMLGRPLTSTFPAKQSPTGRRARAPLGARALGARRGRCVVRAARRRDPRTRGTRRRRPHRAGARDLRRGARALGDGRSSIPARRSAAARAAASPRAS